ncbi:MAG: tRNA (adenosine(37)-N6)-threonylcarbamoyltransferase complex ATPase subunit type 1 TsaE [Lachnospiraceae bacterium]|jgi:tRNA threonylcarbamoyladenosine biosynthesis protein TsaE|nr:tRNA (adenosine(37)-N6)-threonylcarbamoyltransferase complex ATPase subunit type 1 TsaE [Lachnospiraceae bacterium]
MKKTVESYSPDETRALAREMSENARAGQIYTLDGDLGAGKTVFAKGFAEGLGIREIVNSPTFTILQSYEGGRLTMHHFDVYRIADPEEMEEIGYEEFFYGDGVCLVEWADQIADLIPDDAVRIRIARDPDKGTDYRKITVDE